MDDLIERLRGFVGRPFSSPYVDDLCIDAADRIAALEADNARLMGLVKEAGEAGASVIEQAFDYYTARNGRKCSIEGDDGEKCWIVSFDAFESLRATLVKIKENSRVTD